MGALVNKKHTLASNVADSANFTTAYPSGVTQADLIGSTGGVVVVEQDVIRQGAGGFTVAFGSSNITVTNDSDYTWPAGAELILSFGDSTNDGSYNPAIRAGGIVALTTSVGTASDTIADVGGSFNQSGLNNIVASLAAKINEIVGALENSTTING